MTAPARTKSLTGPGAVRRDTRATRHLSARLLLTLGLVAVGCQLTRTSREEPSGAVPLPGTTGATRPAAALAARSEPKVTPSPRAPTPLPSAGGSQTALVTSQNDTDAAACPSDMVRAGDFCIDRFEAHLVTSATGGALEPHPHQKRPQTHESYRARSAAGVLPQAYISRIEAAQACENAEKRLCSVKEWFAGCRGSLATTYPYGATFEPGRCNVGKPHLLSQLFGTNPRAWKYDEHFNNPKLDQLAGYLEPTGHFAGCQSSFGVYDMVGNLHEWVMDRVDSSLAVKLPLKPEIRRALRRNAGKGIFMGGFFSTTHEHGSGCGFVTIAHEAAYHDYSTGFRCCRDL